MTEVGCSEYCFEVGVVTVGAGSETDCSVFVGFSVAVDADSVGEKVGTEVGCGEDSFEVVA